MIQLVYVAVAGALFLTARAVVRSRAGAVVLGVITLAVLVAATR